MTRSLCLLGLAAACLCTAFGAHAQELQLHGLLDLSAGRFHSPGAARDWRVENGAMSPSFIAVRGSDGLGGGLKAVFAFGHFLRADTGQAGRFYGDAFWAREAHVGLSGAFGTTVLGRSMTPLFVSTVRFSAFGDSFAFSPSVRQLFAPSLLPFFGDRAWNNAIAYSSNGAEGLSQHLIASLGEGAGGKNFGAGVRYFRGPLGATVAWQRVRPGEGVPTTGPGAAPAGFTKQETWLFGASYDLTLFEMYGQYTHVRTRAAVHSRTELWSVGTSMPLGAGKLLAQYGHARASMAGVEPRNRTFSIGYDHHLSPRTDVYAVFMNDRVSPLGSGNSFAGGLRTRF